MLNTFTEEEFDKFWVLVTEITEDAALNEKAKVRIEVNPTRKKVKIILDEITYDQIRKKEKFSTVHIPGEEPVEDGIKITGLDAGIFILKKEE